MSRVCTVGGGCASTRHALIKLSPSSFMYTCLAGMTPQQVLQSNTDRWMMIPSSGVDLTGTVCNKVGTSYTAFRYGQTVSLLGAAGMDASLEPSSAIVCIKSTIAMQQCCRALVEKHHACISVSNG